MSTLKSNSKNFIITLPWILLTLFVLYFALIQPLLIPFVKTLDGVDYAKMAINLTHNIGSYWSPQFTKTRYIHFYEHPPVGIWYFAIFFKLFGDSWITDKIIAVTNALWLFVVMYLFYRRDFPKVTCWILWLPLLLLISNPFIYYYIDTNKLESIATPLMLSILYWISNCRYKQYTFQYLTIQSIIAGFICVVGFEINGLLALYVWPAYICCALTSTNISLKRAIQLTCIMVASSILFYLLLILSVPAAAHNNWMYLTTQLFPALLNKRTDVTVLHGQLRFLPLMYYIHFLFPWVLIILCCFFSIKYFNKQQQKQYPNHKTLNQMPTLLFYFYLGCLTTLPLMLSGKVLTYYNYQTNVFLTLLFATLFTPSLTSFYQYTTKNSWNMLISWILCLASFFFILQLKHLIDHDLEYDYGYKAYQASKILTQYIPDNSIVSLPPHLLMHEINFLEPNLSRYYNISLLQGKGCEYYIDSIYNILPPPKGYHKIKTALVQLVLYKRDHALATCHPYPESKTSYYNYGYPAMFLI